MGRQTKCSGLLGLEPLTGSISSSSCLDTPAKGQGRFQRVLPVSVISANFISKWGLALVNRGAVIVSPYIPRTHQHSLTSNTFIVRSCEQLLLRKPNCKPLESKGRLPLRSPLAEHGCPQQVCGWRQTSVKGFCTLGGTSTCMIAPKRQAQSQQRYQAAGHDCGVDGTELRPAAFRPLLLLDSGKGIESLLITASSSSFLDPGFETLSWQILETRPLQPPSVSQSLCRACSSSPLPPDNSIVDTSQTPSEASRRPGSCWQG